ncbi:MAG: ABC transporter substrate-binding protein [Segniliparus sp.]|uniref:ABC transporter substrate-binding protein n=1 Tax=Segniliparus sp. TaxID=2804064 RepID=UPI003F2F0B06
MKLRRDIPSRWRKLLLAGLISATLGLSGCSLPFPENSNDSDGVFPYRDRDNCGMTVKYDLAPIRAVTLTPGATDLLDALGVSKSVVATDLGPDFAKIRATNSDFVYAGTMSGMAGQVPAQDPVAGGAPLRDGLRRYDHPTHISVLYCPGHLQNLDAVYLETTIVGDVFGVPEAAAKLVDDWRRSFDQLTDQLRGAPRPSVVVVDARGQAPKLAGPASLAQTVVTFAGGANIATGSEPWIDSDWAAIKAAKPDAILLVQGSKSPADPTLAQKVKKMGGLDDGFFEAGPKVFELAQFLAKTLHPDKF